MYIEAEKRLLERKRRREEILAKHNEINTIETMTHNNAAAPSNMFDTTEAEDEHEHELTNNTNGSNKNIVVKINKLGIDDEFMQLENEKSAVEAASNKKYDVIFDIFSSTPSDLEKQLHTVTPYINTTF